MDAKLEGQAASLGDVPVVVPAGLEERIMASEKRLRGGRLGFTLIELLVVITIIGILMALALAGVMRVREAANRTRCLNNLKQLALAMQGYKSRHNQYPQNWGQSPETGGMQTRGCSWLTLLLPDLELENIYKRIAQDKPLSYKDETGARDNLWAVHQKIPVFMCASDTHDGTMDNQLVLSGEPIGVTNYKACAGANWEGTTTGEFRYRKADAGFGGRFADSYDGRDHGDGIIARGYKSGSSGPTPTSDFEIRDGLSNTFAIGETIPEYCGWASWYWWNGVTATCAIPLNWENPNVPPHLNAGTWQDNWGFMSRHPGGGNFAFCDGSQRFIDDQIDLDIYRALATIDGGEPVTGEDF